MRKKTFFGKKYQRQLTLTLEQEELFDLKVKNPQTNTEEVNATQNLPIALRKGKSSMC